MAEFIEPGSRQRKRETDDPEADSRERSNGPVAALWKGRVYHLKGRLTGSPNAVECYQLARASRYDLSAAKSKEMLARYVWAKLDASYWLGLVATAQDNPLSAEDYFLNRTLKAMPGSFWTRGAIYNLGRVYEGWGKPQQAIECYRTEVQKGGPRPARQSVASPMARIAIARPGASRWEEEALVLVGYALDRRLCCSITTYRSRCYVAGSMLC